MRQEAKSVRPPLLTKTGVREKRQAKVAVKVEEKKTGRGLKAALAAVTATVIGVAAAVVTSLSPAPQTAVPVDAPPIVQQAPLVHSQLDQMTVLKTAGENTVQSSGLSQVQVNPQIVEKSVSLTQPELKPSVPQEVELPQQEQQSPTVETLLEGRIKSAAYYPGTSYPLEALVYTETKKIITIFDHTTNRTVNASESEFTQLFPSWIRNNGTRSHFLYPEEDFRISMVENGYSATETWELLQVNIIGYYWRDEDGQSPFKVRSFKSDLLVSDGSEHPSMVSNEFLALNEGLSSDICNLTLDELIVDTRKLLAIRLLPSSTGIDVRLDFPNCVGVVAFLTGEQIQGMSPFLRPADVTDYFVFTNEQQDLRELLFLPAVRSYLNSVTGATIWPGQWLRIYALPVQGETVRLSSLPIDAFHEGRFGVAYVLLKGNEKLVTTFDLELERR